MKEARVYQVVRRAARDHERLLFFFEDISHSSYGSDQLMLERVIYFGAKAAHVYIDHVGMAIEIHIPDLRGNDCSGEHFAFPPR